MSRHFFALMLMMVIALAYTAEASRGYGGYAAGYGGYNHGYAAGYNHGYGGRYRRSVYGYGHAKPYGPYREYNGNAGYDNDGYGYRHGRDVEYAEVEQAGHESTE